MTWFEPAIDLAFRLSKPLIQLNYVPLIQYCWVASFGSIGLIFTYTYYYVVEFPYITPGLSISNNVNTCDYYVPVCKLR